jgi:hypothetical protein
MKPIVTLNETRYGGKPFTLRLPITDCNFQPAAGADFQGGNCTNSPAPSVRNISRNYFHKEARLAFVIEASLFAAVVLPSAGAIGISAVALIDFLRALGYF